MTVPVFKLKDVSAHNDTDIVAIVIHFLCTWYICTLDVMTSTFVCTTDSV